MLKETSVEGAGKVLRISCYEAWQIMGRAVERGRKRKGRRKESLDGYFSLLTPRRRTIP
ncbi:MAG: hypothetical protein WBC70_07735 [Candidatus Aminicenantales bacterium]